MEDQSQTENVTNRAILTLQILDVDNFRGNVPRRATTNEEILINICELSQSEIGDNTLPSTFLPENEVLGLEVAMHDVFRVHFFESLKDGIDNEACLVGLELVFGLDLIVELSAFQ